MIRQIVNAVKMYTNNNNILCVISFCCSNNTKPYARLILERIDKCIEITTRGVKDGNHKRKRNRKNDDDLSIDIKIRMTRILLGSSTALYYKKKCYI